MAGNALLDDTFTGTGASSEINIQGAHALSLSGFGSATIDLERSFDDGVTWRVVESFTVDAEKTITEPAFNIRYRLNCSTYTSGTIAYRVQ